MTATDTTAESTTYKSLLVLVGLVFVVAVIFGVFVTTIGVLQSEESADHSERAVSIADYQFAVNDPNDSQVDVSDGIGDRGGPVAYELRLEVQLPDDRERDLTDLQIQLDGANTVTLTHIGENVADGAIEPDDSVGDTTVIRDAFVIEPVAAADIDGTLRDPGDRYELVVPLGVFLDDDGEPRMSPTNDDRVASVDRDYNDATLEDELTALLDTDEGLDNTGVGLLGSGETLPVTITAADGSETTITYQLPANLDDHAGERLTPEIIDG